jgi:V8-like Glu-specific endopeptidase
MIKLLLLVALVGLLTAQDPGTINRIIQYWSPARMRRAIRKDLRHGGLGSRGMRSPLSGRQNTLDKTSTLNTFTDTLTQGVPSNSAGDRGRKGLVSHRVLNADDVEVMHFGRRRHHIRRGRRSRRGRLIGGRRHNFRHRQPWQTDGSLRGPLQVPLPCTPPPPPCYIPPPPCVLPPPPPPPPPITGSTEYLDPALFGTFPFPTVGKVFITQGGIDYVCSGSSTGGNIVTTAGHCVADMSQFSTNFMFVPGYFNGVGPSGVWVAASLHTTPEWFNNDDFGRDVGFAVVSPMGGLSLEQTVGALHLSQCGLGDPIVIAAYPAETPWNGQQIVTTTGSIIVQDPSVIPPTNGMVSGQTGGSSGGPWIKNFALGSNVIGTNQICGVVSYSYGNDGVLYSSQFDAYIQGLHDTLLGL